MAILKIKDKGVWKEIQAIKGDTGHDVYVGNKSEAPSESKLIVEPIRRTSTGTNIQINDTISDKTSIKLDGKSTQETRSGKNLWKPIATATKSGMTFTNNGDGSYTLNGTATAGTSFYISGLNYVADTYTLSGNNAITNSNGSFYIQAEYSGGSIALPFTSLNAKTTKTTTKPITALSVVIPNGLTLTNFTFKPQLEQGSTATDYEQYGASPSPDYPSEIESIKGKNLFNTKLLNKYSYVSNGITTIWENDLIKVNGKADATWANITRVITEELPIGTYTFSTTNKIPLNIVLKVIYEDNTSKDHIIPQNGEKITFTTTQKAIKYYVFLSNLSTTSSVSYSFKVQLEQDSTATEYAPYNCIEVKSTGKNLWSTELEQSAWSNSTGSSIANLKQYCRSKDFIKVKPNSSYELSYNANNVTIIAVNLLLYDKNKNFIKSITGSTTLTTADTEYMKVNIYASSEISPTDITDIQLEQGSTATEYEPYQSSSTIVDLKGNELTKYDKLIIKDGKATIQKKSRHLSLAIKDMNNSDAYPGWTNQMQLRKDYPNLNNSFKTANISMLSNITEAATAIGLNTAGSTNVLLLYSKLFDGITQTEIKAKYPDLVFDLIYELSEPYEIDLGSVDTLNTFEGTTYISNSEDADMEVEYSITGTPDVKYKTGADALKDLFPKNVSEFNNDSGYITDENLEPAISTYVTAHKDELKGEQGEPGKDGINGKDGAQGPKGDPGTTTYSELSDKPQIQYKAIEENENVLQQINKTVTLEDIKNLIDLGIYQFIPLDMSTYTSRNKLDVYNNLPDGLYIVTAPGMIDVISDSWDLDTGSRIFKTGDNLSLLTGVGDMFYYYDATEKTYIGGFYVNSSDVDSTIQSYLLDYMLKPKVKRMSTTNFATKLEDNNIYRVLPTAGVTKFNMTYSDSSILPTKTFGCHITLKTSKVSIETTEPSISTKFVGTDCENGAFTPKVGMIYDIEIVWNGIGMVANVTGYAW